MKKRYKGYFKTPTNVLDPSMREFLEMKRTYSNDKKFRTGLWVRVFLR